MKPYTVLLLYPDYLASQYGHDRSIRHVLAESAALAIAKAQRIDHRLNKRNACESRPADYACLLCIAGHHQPAEGTWG